MHYISYCTNKSESFSVEEKPDFRGIKINKLGEKLCLYKHFQKLWEQDPAPTAQNCCLNLLARYSFHWVGN